MQEWLVGETYPDRESHQINWIELRDNIFSEEDNLKQLMMRMQMPSDLRVDPEGQRYRGYMVNWSNIWAIWNVDSSFKTFKPTLEFRQHDCVTDLKTVKHWILLLEAIMKLASRQVRARTQYGRSTLLDQSRTFQEREGSKYPNDGQSFDNMRTFVTELLELPDTEGRYWDRRFKMYKNDGPG